MDMTEVLRFDAQPNRAQQLRLAARMLREPDGPFRQARGLLFEFRQGRLVGYCAMGKLAYLANGRRVPLHESAVDALTPIFGNLFGHRDFRRSSLAGKIIDRNDRLGWSFEQIAEYLDAQAAVEERDEELIGAAA